jgi:hypothetical protein
VAGVGAVEKGSAQEKGRHGAAPFHQADRDQFLARSTILPLEIQGIIARSFSPTFSISCSSLRRYANSHALQYQPSVL